MFGGITGDCRGFLLTSVIRVGEPSAKITDEQVQIGTRKSTRDDTGFGEPKRLNELCLCASLLKTEQVELTKAAIIMTKNLRYLVRVASWSERRRKLMAYMITYTWFHGDSWGQRSGSYFYYSRKILNMQHKPKPHLIGAELSCHFLASALC